MSVIVGKDVLARIEQILDRELLQAGAEHVIIVDMSGNLIMERGSLRMDDISALAVLSAANFAATAEIAKLIGEEDFTLLFHKGDTRNIHFNRLGENYIIITLFNETVSLGLIRLKSSQAIELLAALFDGLEGKR